jgi:AcrR family transcriptional regulator
MPQIQVLDEPLGRWYDDGGSMNSPPKAVRAKRGRRVHASKSAAPESGNKVSLGTKTLPLQARSRRTFDAILRVAGEVLAEDGVDGLSVNAVCRRAGFTPPAVYRYFPNKYALLNALADRLLTAQNDAVNAVSKRHPPTRSEVALIREFREVLLGVSTATASIPGSVTLLRALRVTPILKDINRAKNAQMAARRVTRLRRIFPDADLRDLRRAVWLGVEMVHAITELIAEREWEAIGESLEAVIDTSATLMARHYWQFSKKRAAAHSPRER